MKHKKRVLFQSVMALILCCAMLVGTTFAWFTDSVSSKGNIIQSGKLDIEMDYANDLLDAGSDQWLDASQGPIFNYKHWEPGYTDLKYLKITNDGNLAFQYQLTFGLPESTTTDGGEVGETTETTGSVETMDGGELLAEEGGMIADGGVVTTPTADAMKLAQVIDVYYANVTEGITTREDAIDKLKKVGTLADLINGRIFAAEGILLPEKADASQSTGENVNAGYTTAAIMLKMQESAGNAYMNASAGDGFCVKVLATQYAYEKDAFGTDYDSKAVEEVFLPIFNGPVSGSADVTTVNGMTTEKVTISVEDVDATVPAGVAVADGVEQLTLTVSPMNSSNANLELGSDYATTSLDVHMDGVSSDNETPIQINLGKVLPVGMNQGNVKLYHVENGTPVAMTQVFSLEDLDAHNEFYYDPATGNTIISLATFSEIAMAANEENAWNGDIAKNFAGGNGEKDTPYLIANADQLAYMNSQISSKVGNDAYYKLLSDINFGGSNNTNIWYPIGYWAKGSGTNNAGENTWYTKGGEFSGVFDGAGHTITGIYQNTWAMDGNYDNGYWNAAMGLFGYINGGTVKNLTIDNFYSEGEFAPTGCVAAYAGGSATFENIAITNSHPQTYNTGVAGIVGWDEGDSSNFTFKNITVDSSNTISALWGSWDVAAAGLLGYLGSDSKANLENCHVSATIDVYNDVCGNYQYYWYRYCGMLIGTVDKTKADDSLDLSNITATNCTVDFGDRHEYYYCEFIDNSIASYTHDYQFSRVPHKELDFTQTPVVCTHAHSDKTEEINGETVPVEDKRAVYIPFRQIFGGYGWGVDGKEIGELLDIQDVTKVKEPSENDQVKFAVVFENTDKYLYRVGNKNPVSAGTLFKELSDGLAVDSGVHVSVTSMYNPDVVMGSFAPDTTDWTKGQITFKETGPVTVTIQDYNYCKETSLNLEVVDGYNVTANDSGVLTGWNSTNSNVLLENVNIATNGMLLIQNGTLHGNGFTLNVEAGQYKETKADDKALSDNYVVGLINANLNDVQIIGAVYTQYGGAAADPYNFPTVLAMGKCTIANSYISNCASPVRALSTNSHGLNLKLINTTLEGGNFANLDIRGGTTTLENVTTINQSRADGSSISNDKNVVGLGIVVQSGSDTRININGLTQYNNISEKATFSDSFANTLKNTIFGPEYTKYQFESEDVTWANTGIISMVAGVTDANYTPISDYEGQSATISGYTGHVYAPVNKDSVQAPDDYVSSGQYEIAPMVVYDYTTKNNKQPEANSNDYCYYDSASGKYLISFDDGETGTFDANILTVTKGAAVLDYTVSINGTATVDSNNIISFTDPGDYTVTFAYTDTVNYTMSNGDISTYKKEYSETIAITVYEVVDTSAKTVFAFGSNGYRVETASNLNYVMPDVNATVNSNTAGIGVTTVGGVNVYYPIVSMHKSGSSYWYNYFSVFEAITITDLNGTVYNTSTKELPSGMEVIGGFILDANGNISTEESANGTSIFNYSTGKTIKCATYSSYGLCYYPNSQFTKTGTSDRAEQTIVAKYRYTDSNGTPYYYYVGYWCEKHTKTSCVTPDTLITLADGTQKRIDEATYNDQFLVWDFVKGEYTTAPASIVMNHGSGNYTVVTLNFSDGTTVNTINGHGFYHEDTDKFVILSEANVSDYVNHTFTKQDGTSVKLVSYDVHEEQTESWSVLTAEHYNCILEGMLTITPAEVEGSPDYLMPFTVGEGMKYDEAAMKADIETYGLYTYEEFAEYMTYEQFAALNLPIFKVAVGKGFITWDEILFLLSIHAGN